MLRYRILWSVDLVATSDHNVQYRKHAEFAHYSLLLHKPAR